MEYGRTVPREVLEQVERGEESLRQLGFRELRVRHHGELARVEIARDELPRALTMEMMDAITAALKQAGFKYVTLDCSGFRSGSMNAVLPVMRLARASSRALMRGGSADGSVQDMMACCERLYLFSQS